MRVHPGFGLTAALGLAIACASGPSEGPAACPVGQSSPLPPKLAASTGLVDGDTERGARLFAEHCTRCHSPDVADRESRLCYRKFLTKIGWLAMHSFKVRTLFTRLITKAITRPMLSAILIAAPSLAYADNLAFLIGSWSTDCSQAQVKIFRNQGQLMQTGLLGMFGGPAAMQGIEIPAELGSLAGQINPGAMMTTPVIAKRKGDRLVTMIQQNFQGTPVKAVGKISIRSRNNLYVHGATVCMQGDCVEHRIGESVQRCAK